jgi:hypothetical protein
MNLQEGKYYQINGSKKVLYCDGEKWMQPAKDNRGKYEVWLRHLEKQPASIKIVKEVLPSQIGRL